jgi:hypothetical protein
LRPLILYYINNIVYSIYQSSHQSITVSNIFCPDILLTIAKLKSRDVRNELATYMIRGNILKTSNQETTQDIIQAMKKDPKAYRDYPKIFYFVYASSGKGKSQLAESVELPEIYIPLTYGQTIYKGFESLSRQIHDALIHDYKSFGPYGAMESIRSQYFSHNLTPFRTVGLLLELFKLVYGKSNEESIKLLSGFDSATSFTYKPMLLQEARAELESMVAGGFEGSRCKIPLIFIDEVPPETDNVLYPRCILLRNLIRNMGLVCLLSGSEAAAMNAIDVIHQSSRRVGRQEPEYLRLIVKLPPTDWNVFLNDPVFAPLVQRLAGDVGAMLRRTRPLFVQCVLDAMSRCPVVEGRLLLTAAVLRAAKEKIVRDKPSFTSLDGLYAQLALLHSSFIARTVDDVLRDDESVRAELIRTSASARPSKRKRLTVDQRRSLSADKQACVRHHFGAMRPVIENYTTSARALSLFLEPCDDQENKSHLAVETLGEFKPFCPIDCFELPSEDEMLHIICMRDGVYYRNKRISTSYGLKTIYDDRASKQMNMFGSCNQASSPCSGKFLESEVISAMVVSSHSHDTLSGCPLPFFLQSLVAELNVNEEYRSQDRFPLSGVPAQYERVTVGLLSPANTSWQADGTSRLISVQDDTILLGDCENDGAFPLVYEASICDGAMEAKCYEKGAPKTEFTRAINNHVNKMRFITIMVVTDANEMKISKTGL